MKLLDLIETGIVTPEEAIRLMNAMQPSYTPGVARSYLHDRRFHIVLQNTEQATAQLEFTVPLDELQQAIRDLTTSIYYGKLGKVFERNFDEQHLKVEAFIRWRETG